MKTQLLIIFSNICIVVTGCGQKMEERRELLVDLTQEVNLDKCTGFITSVNDLNVGIIMQTTVV
jgi:hypothetical protein